MPPPFRHVLEDLHHLAVRLPWWAMLLSALAAYAVLHPLATIQMPEPQGAADMAMTALVQLLVFLAKVGQYLAPLALLIAATVSAFERWKRSDLRSSVANDATGTLLRGIPREDFELLVADGFRRAGFQVTQPRQANGDGGIDLELAREGRRYLVHSRHWKAWKLDADAVRDFHAIIASEGAAGGFLVLSGGFTADARHYAERAGIELIDGRRLKQMLRAEQPGGRREPSLDAVVTPSTGAASPDDLHSGSRPPASILDPHPTAAPGPGHADRAEPRLTLDDAEDGMERDIGQSLTAMIRSEDAGTVTDSTARAPRTPSLTRTAERRRPRRHLPSKRRMADLVGVLLTSAGIWAAYQWFQSLPEQPAESPWALLGSGQYASANPSPSSQVGAPATLDETAQRPLGQFNFGGDWHPDAAPAEPAAAEEPVVEEYHSIRELEAAFNVKYVPPPECYDWQSNAQMVTCGNHRMRARRGFIESGGKMTPEMLGAASPSSGYQPTVPRGEPIPDWRFEQTQGPAYDEPTWPPPWQQPGGPDGEWTPEPTQAPAPEQRPDWAWDAPESQDGDGFQPQDQGARRDWRTEQARREEQDWRQDQDWTRERDWRQREWSQGPSWLPREDPAEEQDPNWLRPQEPVSARDWLRQQDRVRDAAPDTGRGWDSPW
jgi:restriction system protein